MPATSGLWYHRALLQHGQAQTQTIRILHGNTMNASENKERKERGELYYAFTPELVAERARCKHACARYNTAGEVPRRKLTELFREYVCITVTN